MTKKYKIIYDNCQACGAALLGRNKKFCNCSCAAQLNNRLHPKRIRICRSESICGFCKKIFLHQATHKRKFCSWACTGKSKKLETLEKFKLGLLHKRGSMKSILYEIYKGCQDCGLNEWRGKKLSLEIDHVDGDALNDAPTNIKLLCPNCHSITPTWMGKNKGRGTRTCRPLKNPRKERLEPIKETVYHKFLYE